MVLVDTSIWVSHLRKGNARLRALLENAEVICHPFIIGELACGNLRNRTEILSSLRALPAAVVAKDEEVLRFIESHRLMGRGLGLIDMHLLASALLTRVPLWTADKRLRAASTGLNLAYP
jgi:predicted nucleic acid-binding protein